MSKKIKSGVYKGLKGWEVNYLKQAEKYGHLTPDARSKRQASNKKNTREKR